VVIYGVAASFCAMALVVAVIRSAALGAALVVVEVLVVFLMRNLGVRGRRELFPFSSGSSFATVLYPRIMTSAMEKSEDMESSYEGRE